MKLADMQKKSNADLEKHADKLRIKVAQTRRDQMSTDSKNTKELRGLKKELARTLTVLTQKEQE